MEKNMETTRMGCKGTTTGIMNILNLHWDNGKEHGNHYNGLYRDYYNITNILGLHRDNGKEHGKYYLGCNPLCNPMHSGL